MRDWHKKAAGRYRTEINRRAWVEIVRDGTWHTYGVNWPHPRFTASLPGPHKTLREAKAAAETFIAERLCNA